MPKHYWRLQKLEDDIERALNLIKYNFHYYEDKVDHDIAANFLIDLEFITNKFEEYFENKDKTLTQCPTHPDET